MATILIIDDDETFRLTLKQMLIAAGHSVTVAADGLEGVQIFRAEPADIVLLDIVMPHSGLMTLRVLRSQYPGIRIIAMTGGAPFRLGVARDLGVEHTLVKPFTSDQLADVITATLANNGMPRGTPT